MESRVSNLTNENRKLVSVIIPVYNGEKYIDKIFRNLKKQSYRPLEIIFIDDASSDGSASIIRSEIKRNGEDNSGEEIQYKIIEKRHNGQGSTRNRGIEEASGEYIAFLDQDDQIKKKYIEKLYAVAERDGSDIVISGYEHITETGKVMERVTFTNSEWCRFMNIAPWGKLYRRSYLITNNIRFFPTVLGEDVYLNIHAYSCGGNISYTDYVGYRWVRNVKSLSNTLHRKYDESVSVISLFDKLLENENSDSWRNDKYYQYFFLKTAIYHILLVSRDTKFDELMRYEDAIFKWFAVNMRGALKNSLIGLGKPDGERLWIRVLVTCFMMLRRWNLDKIFLVTVSIAQRLLLLNPFLFGVFSKKPLRKKAGNE